MARQVMRASFVVTLGLAALAAEALDAKKAALSLAKSAASAFETGEMPQAARLYLEAYRTNPKEPSYLYGAARAEQAAGQTDHAEQHYRQFMETPGADAERVARAKGFLNELAGLRADEKAETGERFAGRGEWTLAAAAFAEAARLRPDRVVLLYRAGTAAHEAGDKALAAQWLGAFLAKAAKDAPDRTEAKLLLESLTRPGAAKPAAAEKAPLAPAPVEKSVAPEAKKPEPAPVVVAPVVDKPRQPELTVTRPPEAQSTTPRTAAWITLGTGGALALVGGIVGLVALSQESAFKQDLHVVDGKVTGTLTDPAVAHSRADAIASRETTSWALMGVGAAALGVGSYLLLTTPSSTVSLAPEGRGVRLSWRF